MRRTLLIAGVVVLMLSGCSARTSSTTRPSSGQSNTSVAASSNVVTRSFIPSLELVGVSAFAKGVAVTSGETVAPSTYRPFLTGAHLTSVEWVTSGSPAAPETMLSLVFDTTGADVLERWTTANVGALMAVVVGGRVVEVDEIVGPLHVGSFALGGSEVVAARSFIDSDTVRWHQ